MINYKDFENPLSKFIISHVCGLCEVSENEIVISKDGCGLPVIATTLESLGRGFLNLFCNSKYEKMKKAFFEYPYLVGGVGNIISPPVEQVVCEYKVLSSLYQY